MENTNQAAELKPRKKKSQLVEIWKRFKRNPLGLIGLGIFVLMLLLAALADVISPARDGMPGYNQQRWAPEYVRQFPSASAWMGTDRFGRDVFARVAHGARISLQVGVVVVVIGVTVGLTLGAVAGYFAGVVDNVIMRLIDIMLAVPNIIMAIAIIAAIGTGLMPVMIAVGIGAIPIYARTVRAQVLIFKEQEFVEAARACGASHFRIILRHILPNSLPPVIVEASMGMAGAILSAAGLSFIGLGLQPPTPEWGAMLSDGREFIFAGYWHLTVFPGLMIALIIFSLNMMGDGLRDALDPKLRSSGFGKKKFRQVKAAAEARLWDAQESLAAEKEALAKERA